MSVHPLSLVSGPIFDEVPVNTRQSNIVWRIRRLDVAEAAAAGILIESLGVVQAAAEPLEIRLEREHAAAQSVLIARGEQLNLILDMRSAKGCGDEEELAELRQRFHKRDQEARRGITLLRHDAVPAVDVARKAITSQQELLCKVVVGLRHGDSEEWRRATLVMDPADHDPENGRSWVGSLSPVTFKLLVDAVWEPLREASSSLGRFLDGQGGAGESGQAGASLPGAPEPADEAELAGLGD